MATAVRDVYQHVRASGAEARPMPESSIRSIKRWCKGCGAVGLLGIIIAALGFTEVIPFDFSWVGLSIGAFCAFIAIFMFFLLCLTWTNANRVAHERNNPVIIRYGTLGDTSANPEVLRQPSIGSSEGLESSASPELASARESNEGEGDEGASIEADIHSGNLQSTDSEIEAVEFKQVESSTKVAETTSTSTDELSSKAANEEAA